MNLEFSKQAEKQLDELAPSLVDNIINHLCKLINADKNLDIKKLNQEDLFRLRIGQYRVIYINNYKDQTIRIIKIQHRKDIYKKRK